MQRGAEDLDTRRPVSLALHIVCLSIFHSCFLWICLSIHVCQCVYLTLLVFLCPLIQRCSDSPVLHDIRDIKYLSKQTHLLFSTWRTHSRQREREREKCCVPQIILQMCFHEGQALSWIWLENVNRTTSSCKINNSVCLFKTFIFSLVSFTFNSFVSFFKIYCTIVTRPNNFRIWRILFDYFN